MSSQMFSSLAPTAFAQARFVQPGFVQPGFVQPGFVQAVLMQACLRAARNAARRALRAALDAAPYRRSGPQRLSVEQRNPMRLPIRGGIRSFDARSFPILLIIFNFSEFDRILRCPTTSDEYLKKFSSVFATGIDLNQQKREGTPTNTYACEIDFHGFTRSSDPLKSRFC